MNRTRRIAILTLSLLTLGAAACGTSQPSSSGSDNATAAFALWAHGHVDDIEAMNDHVKAGTAHLDDYEVSEAASEFRTAASILSALEPPTETHAGQLTNTALRTCERAYNASADAVEDLDVDAMNAAQPLIKDCTADLETATAALPS